MISKLFLPGLPVRMVCSAGGAASRVDAERAAARRTAPFCPFAIQECRHSLFADERQVLHRRFAQRIIVRIPVFPLHRFLCRGIADIHRRNRRVAFCGSCRLRSYTAKNRIPVSCRRGPNIRCRGSLPAGPRCKRCNRGRTGRSFLRDNPFHSCFKGRDDCRRPCNIRKKS